MLMNGYSYSSSCNTNAEPSRNPSPTFITDPLTIPFYPNPSDNFIEPKLSSSYMTQYSQINSEIVPVPIAVPVCYSEALNSSELSASITSYTIEQSQVRSLHVFL